ncbi:Translation elongation factor G-related protein [Candidatus Sumerlaea chitinivorans]|uniref:Elongation factor G n=1 Tax=Sumerlaea chitinivorans TaxID=2250252 RepID=A0A2Z4Y828_SUMC1|nr:Translation elongation factor G-related protein [Candidatus Sumerlaea chitinivorans]
MKEYASKQIRNIAFAGHSGSGKTTLTESILYNLKLIDRMGRVEDGNTVSDYDPEEQKRLMSINASLIPVEYRGHKINILDLPGYRDFVGEIRNAIRVCDAVVIVVDASGNIEVGAELAWEYAEEFGVPRVLLVNKMNRERANFDEIVNQAKEEFGGRPAIVSFPVGAGTEFQGIVSVLSKKMTVGNSGKAETRNEVPASAKDQLESLRAELIELAAEGDDELTMKFLDGGNLTDEEVVRGLKADILAGRILPVLAAAPISGAGVPELLDFIVDCLPAPSERPPVMAKSPDGSQEIEVECDENAPTVAFVFKTVSDPYAGRLTFFKVLRGKVENDTSLLNVGRGVEEKVSHLMTVRGKKSDPVNRALAGDIAVLAKLSNTFTGDTLCDPKVPVKVEPTPMPPHTIQMAIVAKSKDDEEKIGLAMHRLIEQDPTLHLYRDSAIRQTILCGMGDTHLDVAVSRLKSQNKVEVELEIPKVPYRETITKVAQGQGKHKKQSGGRGQFGECWLRLEPLPEGSGFQFEWQIVGGVIPSKFAPSVEKGIIQAMERGVLAGCPVVDVKAICYDGKDHPVDSSDMAFQIAASKGFKAVAKQANPILLEPIYKVKVIVPEQYMGDVMGDLNAKRGRILGMTPHGKKQIIEALVPLAEMFEYSKQLRSMTQGRGTYEMVFDHYERVPAEIQAKVVASMKPEAEEEEE